MGETNKVRVASRSRTIALCMLLAVIAAVLAGCGPGAKQRGIYDDESQIVESGDSYSFAERLGGADEGALDLEYAGFYGVQTIWTVSSEQATKLSIEFDSQVRKGKFKLVLVTPEQQLITVLDHEGDGKGEVAISAGDYALKIVGYNASGQIKLQLKAEDEVELTPHQ